MIPLYIASANDKLEVVKYLVEEGKAEFDRADNEGVSPLYVASELDGLLSSLRLRWVN